MTIRRVPPCLILILLFSLSTAATAVVSFAQEVEMPPPPPAPASAPAEPPALAQNAPPPTPPAQAPDAPDAPEPFSLFFNGDSYLGIYPEDVNTGNMKQYGLSTPRGVAAARVMAGSPAERAGLRKDDVILRFNGEEVTSARKLSRLISEVAPDHTVRLLISRGGAEHEISVTLAKRENSTRSFSMTFPPQNHNLLNDQLGRLGDLPGFNGEDFSLVFGANRRIGVGTSALTKQLADYFGVPDGRGVLITSVSENSPAAKVGLKAGDVITAVDGNRVEKVSDLMRQLNRKSEGEITLTIIRDKSQRTFKLTPERGRAFDFAPEIEQIAPQVGRLVIPRGAVSAIPAINLRSLPKIVIPKMVLPVMPKITVPKIKTIALPLPL